jgi:hypothetical protein
MQMSRDAVGAQGRSAAAAEDVRMTHYCPEHGRHPRCPEHPGHQAWIEKLRIAHTLQWQNYNRERRMEISARQQATRLRRGLRAELLHRVDIFRFMNHAEKLAYIRAGLRDHGVEKRYKLAKQSQPLNQRSVA